MDVLCVDKTGAMRTILKATNDNALYTFSFLTLPCLAVFSIYVRE